MNYEGLKIFIDNALKAKNISKTQFAENMEMTRAGYNSMIKTKSMRIDVFEKIASQLHITPSQLMAKFEDDNHSTINHEFRSLEQRVSSLEEKFLSVELKVNILNEKV